MLPRSTGLVSFVFFHISCCFALLENIFLIYDKNVNKCLKGHQPLKLFYCDVNQQSQQFRWTSNDRIFNVYMKKCLGAGSKENGSGLQWYICDDTSDLQKWECKNATMLNLKGTNLYLSQDENTVLKLTQDIGAASQWLIHGTSESLCSQPYQELYTIEGNAFGRPCHFPFKYEGRWYSDCVLRESSKRLWCSTDRVYQEKWGYCPTKSTDHWKKNPVTGIFYQVNINSALTWHQARSSCQQQDSDLLSITEPQEQTFISGITSEFKTILWIGLNRLNTENGWQWTNEDPFCYLRWGSGQPSRENGWSCGCLSTMENYSWQNRLCSRKHGYICKKRITKPTSPPGIQVSCSAPWIPYTGHCYFLNRTKNTWKDANTQCMNAGGHLVSIRNIEEQSFVLSQLGYMETDKLWIGLNDQKTQLLFEWNDQSPVTFTAWDAQEPSHHRSVEEDCVLMGGKDGKWADVNCGEKNGFICKRAGDSKSSSGSETENIGCKAGWTRYGYNCYFVGSTTKTFDEAKKSCQETGAHLTDIPNRVENAFLISLVGARPEKHFWIGLSNLRDRHTFEWTNTQNVPYTHWNTNMPGQKQGCVAMRTGPLAGLWEVLSCSNMEKYICKHQAEGVVTTPAPPTSPAPSCAEGWKPIGVRNFCYKFYEMDEYDKQKTWFAALDFCRSIGGDLISIHSHLDNLITGTSWHAWIGYSAQDPSVGYTWSDGTASSYTNWKSEEPDNKHNVENCAGIEFPSLEWEDRSCEMKDSFICEIRKGVIPKEPANFTISEYNVTEDGWIEFGGHQYYISSEYHNIDDARTFCRKGHGDLVAINTESERIFLWKQIVPTYSEFFIGLEIDWDYNMQWMDGTPVVFLRWDENQPPDEIFERCVTMAYSYGLWSVNNCGRSHPFICERHEAPAVNATLAPTEAPKGGCAPDWTKYKQHCYKTELSPKTWKEALVYCRSEGGSLVSVRSQEEQAFLTTMMLNAPGDLWIGMRSWFSSVLWSDGKPVVFTNFNRQRTDGYPDLYPYWHRFDSEEICYKMILSPPLLTGKWRPAICNDTYGYICKRSIDSHIVPQTTVLPLSYVKSGNDSLKVEPNNLTWWEAKKRCETDDAKLASIRDGITQAFIELQIQKLKQPMWIGLNKNETDGYFRWIDGWPLNMVNWKNDEPQAHFSCVYADIEGYWKTAPCDQSLPSVCKRSTDIAPTPDTRYLGMCPESTEDVTWIPFRGYCYMLSYKQDNGANAFMTCSQRGASLLSIEDAEEAKFVNCMLEMLQDTYNEVWIGLYKNFRGQWHWLDKSVVDYTNWAEGHPEEDDDHAWISTSDFKWRSGRFYMYNVYICKAAKVPITASFTEKPAPQDAPRSFALTVVVIIVVVILVGIAAFIYRKGYRPALPNHPTVENPMYYKILNPAVSDTKTLIHDTELEGNCY